VNVLSLFSGIGGLDLGLERAGMTVVGQVEIDELCRRILVRHWPEVPQHDDVRTCPQWWGSEPRPGVDVVAGGFPCQPFSIAGSRSGTTDERWGWPWMADVIRLVRPRYVIVENVAALLTARRAFGMVLTDLATLGFDADWGVLPACALGAPHTRDRLFLVAYPHRRHGHPRLGPHPHRPHPIPNFHDRARAWRDRVITALETSRGDDRDLDGAASQLVAAGGNAVVPHVADYIARLITTTAHPHYAP
jgi:DNA (cytosine-5)-methyltransferase 1